jgi:ferrous iron transport protein B
MVKTFALAGNPNVGKTAVFNALTGLSQSTGNYAGVTVSRTHGTIHLGEVKIDLADLPGVYSLAARSPDEIIVADILLNQRKDESPIDGIIVVVDASNLERNLYFVSQLIELNKPFIVALNMMDIADRRGFSIDHEALAKTLGAPVVPICAHKKLGIDELRKAILQLHDGDVKATRAGCVFPESQVDAAEQLAKALLSYEKKLGRVVPAPEASRILIDQGGYAETRIARQLGPDFTDVLRTCREAAVSNGSSLAAQEAKARYAWVKEVLAKSLERPATRRHSRSERIDNVLTHKLFGTLFFLGIMMVVFQSIYSWAGPVMDAVDGIVGAFGDWTGGMLPEGGMLQSMLVDGIIAGVGGVIIFLPQILLLSLFISVLEDCGYMARAAFLMDKLLGWCGLSGQCFIPMLSSFACAIPGIMATRTISDRRDRFTTILVAPLMSCSARLPVYVIMIGAFVPDNKVLGGLFSLPALTLFLMYALGVAVAVPIAWLLKKTVFKGEKPPFILEMPSYKVPQASVVARKVYREGREFVQRAGTLIFAVTIVVWALAYFPRAESITETYNAQRAEAEASGLEAEALEARLTEINDLESGDYLRDSYLGRVGHFVEPVFRPLGWDWRIATATIASFPAREIIVATLGTLFNLGADEDAESEGLLATLQGATWPDGRPLFNIAVALSIMVFFALCAQCAATLVTIKRETGQWRWPVLTFVYMTVLAYAGAFIAFHAATLAGLGA